MATKNTMTIAREVIAGDWGSGQARVDALRKKGHDPEAVQTEVNRLLSCRELIIQNIRAWAVKTAAEDYRYIYWTEQYGHECAKCHPHGGKNLGWQCIGWVIACWHHGGLPIPCDCGVLDNGTMEKIYKAKTDAEALKLARKALGINDIKVIRNGGKLIPKTQVQPGDIGGLFTGNEFQHLILLMGDGKVSDSTRCKNKADDIRADRNFAGRYVSRLKVLIRYTGNGLVKPAKKTTDELAQEVIIGLWGSGDSRKKALTECGYNYDAVQKRVNEILNPPEHVKTGYPGKLPTVKLVKTNAEVIADTITWIKWIAGDNRFHYGHGQDAHHNGCFFCGTQPKSKKNAGIVDYERTYCCNPLVGAAWAHGGCDQAAYKLCKKGTSWDFHKGRGYDKSTLFKNLGKPAKSQLKAGDVLCKDTHVALYIGGGKIAEASGGDDNVRNSQKWNNSIHVVALTDKRYASFKRVHRYIGSVNASVIIRHGEVSKRVALLQQFLVWYGSLPKGEKADGIYGDKTLAAVKRFQTDMFGAKEADGLVGPKTIAAMAAVKK